MSSVNFSRHTLASSCLLVAFVATNTASAQQHFRIQVVDDATGRGVPLVELRTVNGIRLYTDSAGVIAFHEPGLMDQPVYFHVQSHGYEYTKDGFGYRGARLHVKPGGNATLRITRKNIAERLYRVTGAGIYRDSLLVGDAVPLQHPVLNGRVFGSDSVVNAVFRGKIHWFWGDTNRPSYPLGNFHVPGATSRLPGDGGLDPEVGVDLQYFVDKKGFAKPTAEMPGQGPTWIHGLVTLVDDAGDERLFATYVKVKPPLKVYQRGLAEFDAESLEFRKLTEYALNAPIVPVGHPFVYSEPDGENPKPHVYFGNPFPHVRVRATPAALRDLSRFEAFTCLMPGSRGDTLAVERQNGNIVFAWKKGTAPYTPKLQARLLKEGLMTRDEALFQLYSKDDRRVLIHSGSTRWNPYRQRWIHDRCRILRIVVAGRSLVRGIGSPGWPLEKCPQDCHARQVHLLQPQAP